MRPSVEVFVKVGNLDQKLRWFCLKNARTVRGKPDKTETDLEEGEMEQTGSLQDRLNEKFLNAHDHWIARMIQNRNTQVKLMGMLALFAREPNASSYELLHTEERSKFSDNALSRWRADQKMEASYERAFASLAGFGVTAEFEQDHEFRNDTEKLWDDWFEKNWPHWRGPSWEKFTEEYFDALCEGRLNFPPQLRQPNFAWKLKTLEENPLPRSQNGEKTEREEYQFKEAWLGSGRRIALGITIIIAISGLVFIALNLASAPAKATGDCVPGLGDVQIRQAGAASDDPLTADCSPQGEFTFPAAVAGKLGEVTASQTVPAGFADQGQPLPLSLSPLNAADPFADNNVWRAADFGPSLSPAGMIYSSRVVVLDLTCRDGNTRVLIERENAPDFRRACKDERKSESWKPILPVTYDGQSRQPLKITYLQNGKAVEVCNLLLGFAAETPLVVRSIADCSAAPDRSAPPRPAAMARPPLRAYYPDADVYADEASGLTFLRDLNRYGNHRHWNAGGTNGPLSGLLQKVRSDTGDDRWRFATAEEVNVLLASLLDRDPDGETVARLFKGRLTSKGGYVLTGLAKDEGCQETGFRRIGLRGRWPLQEAALEFDRPVNPCAVTDKNIGFWLVRDGGGFL